MSEFRASAFLGIDTSNYTTSAAICAGGIARGSGKLLEVAKGARGVRQSDAVFAHVKNLPSVIESLHIDSHITAVGCSSRPRDVEGSYMPCFLAGVAAASAAAEACGVPLYKFSHQRGHIAAALLSAGRTELYGTELLAVHASGGTTEILYVCGESITVIGGTLDIAAGQIIDRVGVMLGMDFPCGPALEIAAGDLAVKTPPVSVKGSRFNLSGMENMAAKMNEEGVYRDIIAATTLEFVSKSLVTAVADALGEHPGLPVLFAGGVMSCKRIKQRLTELGNVIFAEPSYCRDNAMGTAWLAEREYLLGHDGAALE